MYQSFYGFKEMPFNITPDPKFLYLSPTHQEALQHLKYGVQEKKGFIVLIGEVTHRLRWIDPWGGYWEAGDGPYALPRRFRAKDISGKVVAIARGDEFVDVIPVGGSPRVVLGLRLLVWRNRQRVGVRPVARVIFGQSADV